MTIDPPRRDINPPARFRSAPVRTTASADYAVGKNRPPKHTQFKPGKSGNPKGRPKGARGLHSLVRELLTRKVTVRTGDGPKKMTKMEAMLHKLMEKAFAGDVRSASQLMQLYSNGVPEEAERATAAASGLASEQEEAAYAALCEHLRNEIATQQAGGLQ